MPTPVNPDKYARAVGFDPFDFVEAVQNGEDDYSGVPIGSWRQHDPNGGLYLAVPDDHAREVGFKPDSTTGHSRKIVERVKEATETRENPSSGGLAAVADAAPPATANAGAAYAAGKFADAVKERPEVMGDVVDVAGLGLSAGIAYATAEEGQPVKTCLAAGGLFAAFKGVRMGVEWGKAWLEERKRRQRHQMQKERNQMQGNATQRRSVGDGHPSGTVKLEGTR